MDFKNEQIEPELTASKKNELVSEGQLTVDVFQNDKEIIVQSTIAGVSADDLDVSLTPEMVTIRGMRHSEEKAKEGDYYHRELYWGAFSRSIILPEEVDVDHAKATIKNGLLTLRLPKISRSKSKRLKVGA